MKVSIAKNAKIFFIISAVIILVGLVFIFTFGLNFGLDFAGGMIMTMELDRTFETSEVRAIVDNYDKEAEITAAGDTMTQVIISSKLDLTEEERRLMIEEIQTAFDVDEETLAPQVDKVSASMSGEITYQSIMACIVVVVCMLVYITIRFEFLFGVAAIIALLHDILLVVGMFAIFRIQVNTPFVAALLTILGYSINNTIIIFDRVRENRKRYKKYDYENLVDDSIQQCLRRSINTSITTLLTITTLYVLGVDDVKSFALPLIVGFLGGTYSSLFLAAPIWYKLRKAVDNSQKKKRQLAK